MSATLQFAGVWLVVGLVWLAVAGLLSALWAIVVRITTEEPCTCPPCGWASDCPRHKPRYSSVDP